MRSKQLAMFVCLPPMVLTTPCRSMGISITPFHACPVSPSKHKFERHDAQYALLILLPMKEQIPKQIKSSCNLLFQTSSQALKDLLKPANNIATFTGAVSFSEAMIPTLLFNEPLCLIC
jgi:hypothetical protein